MQNAKCKMQNTKYKIQNTKYKAYLKRLYIQSLVGLISSQFLILGFMF